MGTLLFEDSESEEGGLLAERDLESSAEVLTSDLWSEEEGDSDLEESVGFFDDKIERLESVLTIFGLGDDTCTVSGEFRTK